MNFSPLKNKNMRFPILFVSMLTFVLFSCNQEKGTKPIIKDINELVFASGELKWKDSYNIIAQTDGILSDMKFEVGTTLPTGALIAKIDNPTNINNTQSATALLAIANENVSTNSPAIQQIEANIQFLEYKYEQDKLQADRYTRLYQSQSVSKVEYENSQLNLSNTLSQLNTSKNQKQQLLQQAKQQQINSKTQVLNSEVNQAYNQVIVPQAGTVIKKMKNTGDFVHKGDIIAIIADAKRIEAILNVDENSIDKVKIGQLVFVKLNTNKEKVYNATISEIEAAFDESTQSFICKVLFDETLNNSLYGTQLEANILVGEKKNALLIPRLNVGFGNKVNVKGKNEYVIIKPGIVSSEYVEVLAGIGKDDIILPLKK